MPKQETPNTPRNNNWLRRRVAITTPADAIGAKQNFKQECDINFILDQYQRTGAIYHFNTRQPEYGYAEAVDFREALEIVKQGQSVFEALPSSLRARFQNDPAQFLEFVQDPANSDEMAQLGLRAPITPRETEALAAAAPAPDKAATAS